MIKDQCYIRVWVRRWNCFLTVIVLERNFFEIIGFNGEKNEFQMQLKMVVCRSNKRKKKCYVKKTT